MMHTPFSAFAGLVATVCLLPLLAATSACGSPAPRSVGPISSNADTISSDADTISSNADTSSGVRAIDWQNRTYTFQWKPFAGEGGGDVETYTVTNGRYDDEAEFTHFWVAQPVFGDLTGDGLEEAVILATEKAGDPLLYPVVQIYSAEGSGTLLGTVAVDEVAGLAGAVAGLAVTDGYLTLTRYVTQEGDDFRSPSMLRHERWGWDGQRLVEDEAARTTEHFDSDAYYERLERDE